jgi:hypothetical protein
MQLMPKQQDSGTGTTNFQFDIAASSGMTKFLALAATDPGQIQIQVDSRSDIIF